MKFTIIVETKRGGGRWKGEGNKSIEYHHQIYSFCNGWPIDSRCAIIQKKEKLSAHPSKSTINSLYLLCEFCVLNTHGWALFWKGGRGKGDVSIAWVVFSVRKGLGVFLIHIRASPKIE